MAGKHSKKEVDAEIDLHGLNREQMRLNLQQRWPDWRNLRRVRIIHGRGSILKPEVEQWCRDMGIPFAPEPNNPGALRIFPRERTLPDRPLAVTLEEKGLRLTPEQEAYLRDPEASERKRAEEQRRVQEQERHRQADVAARAAQQRRDEALWQQEMARLDALDRSRKDNRNGDGKPAAPRILPPSEIKYQEGYWRAELVRVADTDNPTLQKQKRHGLDKLAPPLPEKPPQTSQNARPTGPSRDTEADRALFEEEMARLAGVDPRETRRSQT
ncbi:MAG TPA: Smr/MutS family protein [Chthonomonadaceae bacterium]|nr:Smr/MutS family protein [Chthonomonadaceae bacterium]